MMVRVRVMVVMVVVMVVMVVVMVLALCCCGGFYPGGSRRSRRSKPAEPRTTQRRRLRQAQRPAHDSVFETTTATTWQGQIRLHCSPQISLWRGCIWDKDG